MATRYWRGGTGTWDATTTTNWSTTSGGAGGASAPTSADAVIFDANSGTGTVTITGAKCASITATAVTAVTKFQGVALDWIEVSGSVNFGANATPLSSADGLWIKLLGTTGTVTISNATLVDAVSYVSGTYSQAAVTVNASGSGFISNDGATLTCTAAFTTTTFYCNAGSTTTGAFTHTLPGISASFQGAGTATINLTNTVLNIYGTSTTGVNTNTFFSVVATVTLTTTGSTINLLNPAYTTNINTSQFFGAGKTYNIVNMNGYINEITDANTFATLTVTGLAFIENYLSITANQTVTGTCTITGNTIANRLIVYSSLSFYGDQQIGTARTLTLSSATASTKLFRWCDVQDITLAVTGSVPTFTSVGDCLGNTGFTFTTPVTRYAVTGGTAKNYSSTALWSATSGGATGATAPLPQDTVVFNASTGAGVITLNKQRLGKDLSFTGTQNFSTTTTSGYIVYGSTSTFAEVSLNLGLNLFSSLYFMGRSVAYTIPTNSTADQYLYSRLAGLNSTYTLTGNITSVFGNIETGTLSTAGYSITATGDFWVGNTYPYTYTQLPVLTLSTSRISCDQWRLENQINAASTLTSSTIAPNLNSGFTSNAQALAYGTLEITNNGLSFSSGFSGPILAGTTFVNWTNSNTTPASVILFSGFTYTVTNFNLNGTKSAPLTVFTPGFLGSPSTPATIAIGATKTTSYVAFSSVTKSGASTLNATGVANGGSNTGITFTSTTKTFAFTGNAGSARTGSFIVPYDFSGSCTAVVLGGGGAGSTSSAGTGGGLAASFNLNVSAGQTLYYSAGRGGAVGIAGGDSWLNTSNAAPTDSSLGARATGGGTGFSSEGTAVIYTLSSGSGGGAGFSTTRQGGGSARTIAYGIATGGGGGATTGGGGGGGGVRGTGGSTTTTTGGSGGLNETSGAASGGATGVAGSNGTLGGGGGGGGQSANGGAGANGTEFSYVQLNAAATTGTTGGGGGGGASGSGSGTGGAGGIAAGGGTGITTPGIGGVGLVVFIYAYSPLSSGSKGYIIG